MTNRLNLKWKRPKSPIIVGMMHDLCKVQEYIIETDEYVEDEFCIKYNKDKLWRGHGEASLIMVQQAFLITGGMILTEEEAACIRYHMGSFVEKEEWEYYSRAVKKYPNVLYTQTADMIASQIREI